MVKYLKYPCNPYNILPTAWSSTLPSRWIENGTGLGIGLQIVDGCRQLQVLWDLIAELESCVFERKLPKSLWKKQQTGLESRRKQGLNSHYGPLYNDSDKLTMTTH